MTILILVMMILILQVRIQILQMLTSNSESIDSNTMQEHLSKQSHASETETTNQISELRLQL